MLGFVRTVGFGVATTPSHSYPNNRLHIHVVGRIRASDVVEVFERGAVVHDLLERSEERVEVISLSRADLARARGSRGWSWR